MLINNIRDNENNWWKRKAKNKGTEKQRSGTSYSETVRGKCFFFFFFNCYLAVPQPTLGHSQRDSLTNLILITVFIYIQPEGNREHYNEVGSLSRPAKHLASFEPGTFRFLLQRFNPLGHSPPNFEFALSITLKEKELFESKHVMVEHVMVLLVILSDMFLNNNFKMSTSFANIARTTTSTSEFIY